MSLLNAVVPHQHTGYQSSTVTRIRFKTISEAQLHFRLVGQRLLNVNDWHRFAGGGTAEFQLLDSQGNKVSRPVQRGDYFQIDIPGPGSAAGGGDDWVEVMKIDSRAEGDEEIIYFTVRTSPHPLSLSNETAHFFSETASSTFAAYRDNTQLLVGVFGRNEKANTRMSRLFDRVRNAMIAMGAWLGLSKLQWKALTHGLIYHDYPAAPAR